MELMTRTLWDVDAKLDSNCVVLVGRSTPKCFIMSKRRLMLVHEGELSSVEVPCAPQGDCALPVCGDSKILVVDGSTRDKFILLNVKNGKVVKIFGDQCHLSNVIGMQYIPKVTSRALQPSFLALSPAGVLRMSTRIGRVSSFGKTYFSKVRFKFAAAAENGSIVLASANGDIRLYDRIERRKANFIIPNRENATLRALEINKDASLILQTFPEYLRLIDTVNMNSSTLKVGGSVRMNFQAASFSQKAPESFIIATGEQCIVLWPLEMKSGRWFVRKNCILGGLLGAGSFRKAGFVAGTSDRILVVHSDGVRELQILPSRNPSMADPRWTRPSFNSPPRDLRSHLTR